jgi:hypothetical protein
MKKYFRIKIGYGSNDFISIDEPDVEKAVRAQVTGKVAIFSEGTVSGNHIISIMPDYNRMLGLKRDYQMTGEDYAQISKATVNECRELLETTKSRMETPRYSTPENNLRLKA